MVWTSSSKELTPHFDRSLSSHQTNWCAVRFPEYEITVSPPYEETMLSITGPDGTLQMFREGLIERLEAGSV